MEIKRRLEELREILGIEAKLARIEEISSEMNSPDFWLTHTDTAEVAQELKKLKDETTEFEDLFTVAELSDENELIDLEKEVEKFEILALFNQKYDNHNAIINFYAGAGGDDAQDWTEMLLRMYLKWAENEGVEVKIIDKAEGGEAGIKGATVELRGSYVYGKLRGENGVHRLVRLSPFNSKGLRQTSFALVQVLPEIEKESELSVNAADIRVDVYRSGGKGGQSVNTTDSAVRITHLPTGIVVICQNERSQLQNKESAMKVLRSRLAALLLEQQKEKIEELKGDFSAPEWGNQIRSYVLHPYKMVKDHRTDFESSNPDRVLSGDINQFIEAELKYFARGKTE
ncbi:MAG: peptide chain release factor 2 [Candidatus Berkelbacteria bacterium]